MDSAGDLPKGGVSPFGYPRINDRSHLPAAFRSVPRPSSPLSAKASTERPCHAPDKPPEPKPPPARRTQPSPPDAVRRLPRTSCPRPESRRRRVRAPHTLNPDSSVKEHAARPSARADAQAALVSETPPPRRARQQAPAPRFRGTRKHGRRANAAPDNGWRRSGSNRRPPACKAGALPAELRPRTPASQPARSGRPTGGTAEQHRSPEPWATAGMNQAGMGQGGLEPPTPRLSSVCSNQLSYWPERNWSEHDSRPSGQRRTSSGGGGRAENQQRTTGNAGTARKASGWDPRQQHRQEPRETIRRNGPLPNGILERR